MQTNTIKSIHVSVEVCFKGYILRTPSRQDNYLAPSFRSYTLPPPSRPLDTGIDRRSSGFVFILMI